MGWDGVDAIMVEADLLKTLPCVGRILSMVLMLEIGRVDRFPTAAHLLACRTGSTRPFERRPNAHGSGLRKCEPESEVGVCGNRQLVVVNHRRLAGTHVVRLYQGSDMPRIIGRQWSPWRVTWLRRLGGCSPGRRFIASRRARGSKLFRRRAGKRGYAASPTRLSNDCDTRSAE